jgi:hypothetical protein
MHASTGIRTHDLSVGASEDSSCLRLRGHCDRQPDSLGSDKYFKLVSTISWSPLGKNPRGAQRPKNMSLSCKNE